MDRGASHVNRNYVNIVSGALIALSGLYGLESQYRPFSIILVACGVLFILAGLKCPGNH